MGRIVALAFLICASLTPFILAHADLSTGWSSTIQWSPDGGQTEYTFVGDAADKDDVGMWQTSPGGRPRQIAAGRPWGYPDSSLEFVEEAAIKAGTLTNYRLGSQPGLGFAVLIRKDRGLDFLMLRDQEVLSVSVPGAGNKHGFYLEETKGGAFVLSLLQNRDATSSADKNCVVVAIEKKTREARVLGWSHGEASDTDSLEIDGLKLTAPNVRKLFAKGEPLAVHQKIEPKPFRELTDVKVIDAEGDEASAISIIKPFTRDLTAKYASAPMENVAVEDDFKNGIMRSLLKIERGSVAVLGPAGSGKSTSTEAVVSALINDRNLPADLRGYTFLELTAASLAGGTMYVGTQEARVNAMLELSRANKIIWVIDEFHSLRGMGATSGNEHDVVELMKRGLTDGTMRLIGMSTEEEFWPAFEGDQTVIQRLTVVKKEEPKGEVLKQALRNWLGRYKLTEPSVDVMEAIQRISTEIDPLGAQPRKSVTLLEEIYAQLKLENRGKEAPTMADVVIATKTLYGLDPAYLDADSAPARLEKLQAYLDENIIGQSAAKQTLLEQTRQVFSGLNDKTKPRVMALFTGPKGRGKTELAQSYALGLGLPFELIEMNSFSSSNGFDRVGLMSAIAKALSKNAFTVIIFDEIEKAPISIQNEVLRLFASGQFTVSAQAKGNSAKQVPVRVNARNATVLLTTNAGSDHLLKKGQTMGFSVFSSESAQAMGDDKKAAYLSDQALRNNLESDGVSEFLLDRVQLVVPFEQQTAADFKAILASHLHRALRAAEASQPGLTIDSQEEAQFLDEMARIYFDPQMSNRDVLRIIGSEVRTALSRSLFGKKSVGKVTINFAGGTPKVSCEQALEKTCLETSVVFGCR